MKFKVNALHQETNKIELLTLTGKNIEEIREQLINSGFIEPIKIKPVRHVPPTEAQLKYARDLRIKLPEDISKTDISVLIDRVEENDNSDPNKELVVFAKERGLSFSDYIGKKALYDKVWNSLYGEHKIAFFIFSIYRWLSNDRAANLDQHSKKTLFYDFAKENLNDQRFIKSLENYRGQDLRFFGTLQFADGGDTKGGSINTIAYKAASNFLNNKLGLTLVKKKSIASNDVNFKFKKSKLPVKGESLGKAGCMALIVGALVLALLFWGFYHLVFNVLLA